ncbi:ATP-binding protein [Alteromonas sp. C1M14]|uniref:sensor histidine kinase n=1 Tax=Alteromonas sp. C1M14 TaxID=2841567 RepID=UPI001C08A586|nr:ATP-binding protein [Alteromonas sp. C1M14]MBU2977394.1 two-component sensor histidine kinase [Alteromonas sp. C1M14]
MLSIRRFLTLTLVSSLVLVIFSAALHGYRATLALSNKLLDDELIELTQAIATIHGDGESTAHGRLFFQVWQHNTLINASSPAYEHPLADFKPGFTEKNFLEKRWRVYTYQNATDATWYMIAQPQEDRFTITDALTTAAIYPFIISVPILASVLFFGITWGLAPLKKLSLQLAKRNRQDLSQIQLKQTPNELKPVMTTLNSLFKRLHLAFEREQQFAANAAHELRTPLSVMKISIHNIANALEEKGELLSPLQADTDRMIHTVNQFLLLSRTSPDTFAEQMTEVNLYHLAQEVISDLYNQIEKKQQEISLEGQDTWLKSTHFTSYTLLQNVIANASKYSPEGAQIVVSITTHEQGIKLSVDDSGPGIADKDKEKVLGRFQRAKNTGNTTGSGLGLAIVSQIVALHDGQITLNKSALGGLAVNMIFAHENTH